jgi:hypothetical protein
VSAVETLNAVVCRRAIEALRSGVPNGDAVRVLGSHQPAIEQEYERRLSDGAGGNGRGMLVAGDFGTGKSHLLEYLARRALDSGFVASKVVISKETPLYDVAKVFRSALDSARLPDRAGAALPELVEKLRTDRDAAERLQRWLHSQASGMNDRFAATLFLLENTRAADEFTDRLVRFWGGDPINVSELRRELRALGEGATYTLGRITNKELAVQRFRFMAALLAEVGYARWVLLFDEVELIGRYSLLQRGRSYAEVARWVRGFDSESIPVVSVLAISADFVSGVLDPKNDVDQVPNRLRQSGKPEDELTATRAEYGMRVLDRNKHVLEKPSRADLERTHQTLRQVHGTAYGWEPPELRVSASNVAWPMRHYVRSWIHEWDLRRLYPGYEPQIEVRRLDSDYSEDRDLERAAPDAEGEPGEG